MKTNIEKKYLGQGEIPAQQTGSEMDVKEEIIFPSAGEAARFFQTVKERLLDVNCWTKIAGGVLSDFRLTDAIGNQVQRKASVGDHIRIDIPGPGTQIADGYDWVRVEAVKSEMLNDAEVLSLIVRPSASPMGNTETTAHFLTEEATSTIQVKRIARRIYAEAHGRNEVPNTDTGNTLDNLRNTIVGWGAKIGISYPQWKALVKSLLNTKLVKNESKSRPR